MDINKVKSSLKKKTAKKELKLLSTGSTLINLACSGKPDGGFPCGGYVFLVGDSMSGKTWLSLTCLAEASINPAFKDYRFIYDNVERGAMMDFKKYFGEEMAKRIEPPAVDKEGNPMYSAFAEEFYFNVDDALEDGRPFIYIEDSMDSLDTFADDDKFDEWKDAFHKGKETKGSFGMSKAKLNSISLRSVVGRLERSNSILIVISQTRDNVDPRNPFQTKTRSGGRALRFYAALEIWSSVKGSIKKLYKGKDRKVGANIKVNVVKSRLTGKEGDVTVPIYYSFGIDNTGSCVDWLIEEGVWKKTKSGVIEATGIGPTLSLKREKLIRHIEENDLCSDLNELVEQEWNEVEKAIAIERKSRYE